MSSSAEIAVGVTVELFLAAILIGTLYRLWGRSFAQRQVILAFQRGVLMRNGKLEKVLDPGTYWITAKRTLLLCDMRPKPFQIPSQELLTADGMGVRMSLGGEHRIADPASFVTESSDAFGAFFLEIRQALRIATGELNGESILNGQALLTVRVKELLVPRGAQLGIELTQLEIWEAVPIGWLRQI